MTVKVVPVMKQFFVVFFNPGDHWIKGKSIYEQPLDGHLAYLRDLNVDGTVMIAGPFRDHDVGMTILQADSDEEARLIVEEDPDVRAGVLRGEVRAWRPLIWDQASDSSEYAQPPLKVVRAAK